MMKFLSRFALYLSFGKNWLKASCIVLKTYQIDFMSCIANSKNPQVFKGSKCQKPEYSTTYFKQSRFNGKFEESCSLFCSTSFWH